MSFCIRFASLLALSLSTVICFAAESAEKDAAKEAAKPKVTISKETTYITQPLRADGYPDYTAALNERMSAGVTPENNAAVLLQQAFGPNEIPKELRAAFFKRLGISELPETGDYFVEQDEMIKRWRVNHPRAADEEDDDKLNELFDLATERPWTAQEFPIVAEWLKLNEKPLALAVQASQKTRRFFPNIVAPQQPLISALLVHDQQLRYVAAALAARAMLETQRGNSVAAWSDLLAMHRLARLTSNSSYYLVGVLVGYAVEGVATASDLRFLHAAKPSNDQIKRFRAELKALPPLNGPTQSLDLGERFVYLDAVCLAAREGFGIISSLASADFSTKDKKQESSRRKGLDALSDEIDWNVSLRLGNKLFDQLAAINQNENAQQRSEAKSDFEAQIRKRADGVKDLRSFTLDFLTKGNVKDLLSPRVANLFAALLLPATSAVMDAYDRVKMWCEMDDAAFALAEYRAEHSQYPETLTSLVPKHLAKLPDDIFKKTAGPIGYRRDGDAYVIWTVFMDGVDSNGRSSEEDDNSDDLALRPVPAPADKAK